MKSFTGCKVIRTTIVKSSVVVLDFKNKLTEDDIVRLYKQAFGWQTPSAGVMATFLYLNGYITRSELLNIRKVCI